MGKEFKDWVDEFVENGANPKDVTNWPEEAGGGSTVVANPTLVGDEPDLTGLEVDGAKYKVPQGGGGPVPALQWNNSMTMTDEIMEKLVNRELELYWGKNRYLYVTNYTEDEGLESEYSIYRFGEAPSIDTYSNRIYINTIEFKKQWGKYFFNDCYFNQYQALPIIEVIGGQVSGSTLTVHLDNDYMKEKFNNNWVSAIRFFVTNGGIFSNLMCYFRAYGANQVYYISPLSGRTYYEVVADIPDFSLEAPDLVFTVEVKDIANMLPAMRFPVLPGEGTSYRLTVGEKSGLSIDEALEILRANILKIRQFNILAMLAGSDKTSRTFTTPVFNNSYYSIVLTPTGDKELTAIEVNITENAVGGMQEPTFNFEVSSLSTSSSGELSADNPIIQWLQALAKDRVETASAKVNVYETSEDGGISTYILLTLAKANISSRGEVTFSTIIGGDGVYSYTLHINPYLASQWYYHFNVNTIVEPVE